MENKLPRRAVIALGTSVALFVLNLFAFAAVALAPENTAPALKLIPAAIALIQVVLAVFAAVEFWPGRDEPGNRGTRQALSITSAVFGLGIPAVVLAGGGLALMIGPSLQGMGWGRPLRLRGKVLQPRLRPGSEWTRGEKPAGDALDLASRRALEALWLHDAQKEHASVPAFSRISWHLIAIGAPPELLAAVHRAAIEEIDHTRRCLALAEGYGGRSHTVEAMPELLSSDLDLGGDPFVRLARESLTDGCQLEDYNADIAAAGERACVEPATKRVLARITREERGHAELSWRLLSFAIERGGAPVATAVERALAGLERIPRPTATSAITAPLVAAADAATLRAHGRLPDEDCVSLWNDRLRVTTARVRSLLSPAARAA